MINIQEILHEIDLSKAVYLDAVNGVAGTEYPIGTERMPASTLANAKTIAGAIGTKTIVIVDDITLNASVAGYTLVGHAGRREAIVVTLNNQSVEDAIFMDLRVTGQANGDAKYINCAFTAVTDMTGEAYDCVVVAAATLGLKDGAGTSFRAVGLAFYAGSTLDINGCRDVDIHNKTGDADIDNVNNAGCTLNLEGTGDTQLLASCTLGTINLYGNQRINDASGGSTINDYTTQNQVSGIVDGQALFKDQWCETPKASIAITNAAADKDFSDVVFPTGFLPTGATIQAVYLMLHWRKQVDSSSGANAINGSSKVIRVKKSGGAWGTDDVVGITFADNSLATDADATEGGTMIIGSHDIDSEVDDVDNETYNIRSEQTNRADALVVDGDALTLHDVFTGLRVYYTVS